MHLKVVVNQKDEFDISEKDEGVFLNDQLQDYSLKKITPDHFLVYQDHKVYDLKILSRNHPNLSVNINGQTIDLTVKDHISQILERLGMDLDDQEVIAGINAPMPGAILEVVVKVGDEVKKGDKLIILEAMKMENVIKSPVDATISAVNVAPGDNVEKNHPLLSF